MGRKASKGMTSNQKLALGKFMMLEMGGREEFIKKHGYDPIKEAPKKLSRAELKDRKEKQILLKEKLLQERKSRGKISDSRKEEELYETVKRVTESIRQGSTWDRKRALKLMIAIRPDVMRRLRREEPKLFKVVADVLKKKK